MNVIKLENGRYFDNDLGRIITHRGDKKHPFFKKLLYEANRIRYARLMEQGLCKECMAPKENLNFVNCNKCSQRARKNTKKRNFNIKLKVFEAYGGPKCNCCGEDNIKFLTMDHINNDGNLHRREDSSVGPGLYRWLDRNNYPPGFQVLCWNCNLGKAHNKGICPHKDNHNDE